MNDYETWRYDEMKQVGTDYADPKHVEKYDERHSQFRDVDGECSAILDSLAVTTTSVILEIGTGTGAFALHAARRCKHVYAIDVSLPMLESARSKASAAGISNVTFSHGGFLTYEHDAAPPDAIVTSMAFHHLPDLWKAVALDRMSIMLKNGGQLYIHDVVFTQPDTLQSIQKWIDHMHSIAGHQLAREIGTHVREEFSTFDWILDGLLERSGFDVVQKKTEHGVVATYLCRKRD